MTIFARFIQVFAIVAIVLSVGGFLMNTLDIIQWHRVFVMNEQDFLFMCLAQIAIATLMICGAQLEINKDDVADSVFAPILLAEFVFFLAW